MTPTRRLLITALLSASAALSLPALAQDKAPRVRLATSLGDIVIELNAAKAPKTVENFRALATGEPSLALPCFPERRYGGVPDDELLMACPPDELLRAVEGMGHLGKNGLRYPFPPYGAVMDPALGMAKSYS